ncbi:MAG: ribose-phosphate pyrophosphokinase [Phycisphaerales bacterium]|nr:ribose-phosphate pyrophosphokinase [Phycisphaerales bacterium]
MAGHCNNHVPVGDLKIFSGTACADLASRICRYLDVPHGGAQVERFPDGETIVKLEDDVRGRDCFVVQSTRPPVNDNLMELLIFIDCLRRASANRITAVMPYFGYARQDRKSEGRTPITAKLVANLIVEAGAQRVLTMNLHADQIQGFFDIPVDHLSAAPVLTQHFHTLTLDNPVVASPDVGNIKFGSDFASRLGADLAVIDKRRLGADRTRANRVVGNVEGASVMMFDDMITTAGTVCEAAKLLREYGAKEIHVAATHAVFAGPAVSRLTEAGFKQIVVSDTIPVSDEVRQKLTNLRVLSVAGLIGEAIRRIHEHRSISELFHWDRGKRE